MALKIISGKLKRAVRTVVYGPEGIGKSTLAAAFPEPLFVDTEGGTDQLDVRRVEPPRDWEGLLQILQEVGKEPGVCRTLVLDSADWAEKLCCAYVCARYRQKNIEDFGYGKGYAYVAEEWGRLLEALDGLIKLGINVVVTAHARQRKQELPDAAGAFDRWELKLSRQAGPLLKEWADLLLFLNYKTTVVEEGNRLKARGGRRVMYTSHHPCWDAKNRYGLKDELPLEYSCIAHIFGQRAGSGAEGKPTPLKKLRAMMDEAGITDAEVEAAAFSRGKCPEGTRLEDMDEAFINRWAIAYFPQLTDLIRRGRKAG